MHRFGNLKTLFFSVARYLAREFEKFPEEKKRAINDNIAAEWLGEQQKSDSEIFGEITPFDIFARRTGYLHESLQELREVAQWANIVPIRKLQIPFAEQLEFVWWFHLNRIQQFQDRAFKFYVAAKELALDEAASVDLGLNKKAFYKKFLAPLSG